MTGRKKALKETHIAIMLTAQYIYTYSFMNVDKQGGKLKRYEGCPVSTRPGSKNRWLGRGEGGGGGKLVEVGTIVVKCLLSLVI